MERAPPPHLAATALAAMDEAMIDTPLSPKRPRQEDPPSQVGTRAGKKGGLLQNKPFKNFIQFQSHLPPSREK